jgi:transcription antitermination factor NusG
MVDRALMSNGVWTPDPKDLCAGQRLAWFAAQVKPNYEVTVAKHLRNAGFESLVPLCRTRRKWSDRIKTVEAPLFPGYVFCEFDPQNRMYIDFVPGVNGIVTFGKELAEIDRGEIAAIRSVLIASLEIAPWPRLEAGRQVEIVSGPLRGHFGTVVGDDTDRRLILSITLLNRSLSVEMDPRWLRI